MDDTDRKLLILISADPRIHLRELAKKLGISKQAVHHRIQVLTETGVIKGMIAGISSLYLNAVSVTIFGRSRTASIETTLNRLGESEITGHAGVAGGNYLYVFGSLRNMSELDSYAEFVKRVAEMPEPTVGVASLDDRLIPPYSVDGGRGKQKESYKTLSPLDLKIIASLKDDARRPIADIARMAGVTPKTAKRHLEDMVSEGSLNWRAVMDLPSGGDMLLIMHVNLRDGTDKGEVGRRLLSKHYFRDQYIRTFSNLPGLLLWVFWTDKMTEIRHVLGELGKDEDVLAVMLNFGYLERVYATWRDRLPEVRTRPTDKARTHRAAFRA